MTLDVDEAWHINTWCYPKAAQKVSEHLEKLDQLFKIKMAYFNVVGPFIKS